MRNTDNNKETQDLYNELVEEVKNKVRMLKDLGLSDSDIPHLLRPEQPLHKLKVDRNYRIFLGDSRKEVCMEPLVKAVYLLFLKHPEGIIFKTLPDYKKELTDLYGKVRPWGLTDRTLQSIEDVTNPLLNSINEKCARIKKVFLGLMDSSMAEQYYIKGTRGEPKMITLPRDLVTWE